MSEIEYTPHNPEQSAFIAPTSDEAPLFPSFTLPDLPSSTRSPHLGHLCLLSAFALFGLLCALLLMALALHLHLGGVSTAEMVTTNAQYILGSETIIYLVTFSLCLIFFPLFWKKSFLAGVHWRGQTALRLAWQLPLTALGCFLLALLDEFLLPGPTNAPIEDIFRTPGAAWLMFAFGISLAPFFEEIAFRGFLLPSLATACDWISERITHKSPRPLDENGHPQWSLPAMIVAAILTSLPFALMHAEQQGHSLGPFLLLIVVSLILCTVRLRTRSLAASVLVHSCYNFMLFSLMFISTDGFRHLEKM